VAALVFGQFAVMMNMVTPEVLVFMGTAAVAQFATSSRELAAANRIMRALLIVLAWLFGGLGFVVGMICIVIVTGRTRAMGIPYLWPVVPFNWRGLKALLVRAPLYGLKNRSNIFHPKD
jgi:stage V sporulation protein AF